MDRFAEEVRLVGRHRVDQVDAFLIEIVVRQDMAAIGIQRVEAEGTLSAAQAPFQHRPLARGHPDAGIVEDIVGQLRKIAWPDLVQGACGSFHDRGDEGHGSELQ